MRAGKAVESESRICFGIVWFASEEDAQEYHEVVRKNGETYNGGWMDGCRCGRAENYDKVVDGKTLYAVTQS